MKKEILTVEKYLRGKVGYDVPDDALAAILLDRDIDRGTDAEELTLKEKRLCTADLYMYCASTPSKSSTKTQKDGGWEVIDGGMEHSAFDARQLREMAKAIYDEYGENITVRSKVKIWNL